jgi:hypothetical protein
MLVLTLVFLPKFSAGMPLMHFVGLVAMVTTYWTDKFSTFLHRLLVA